MLNSHSNKEKIFNRRIKILSTNFINNFSQNDNYLLLIELDFLHSFANVNKSIFHVIFLRKIFKNYKKDVSLKFNYTP
ncbi:MAG: hypothetical protein CVU07_02880 [Bacteroidetes bacterium HGW-Bacteroidetes-23]|nr:MAG: hypothetical protein CVU07_02880 [Bacteroidetes bacterium HGW-Bacteroidetes-23]